MNQALVDRIVNAVLYEGYLLYPYRPSVKNWQRWTFGGLYPRSYSEAQGGSDSWALQTECLVQGGERSRLQVKVRFLHLQIRLVGQLADPVKELPDGTEPIFHVVEKLQVGDRLLHTWQEAVEREVLLADLGLRSLAAGSPRRRDFAFPVSRQLEPVPGPQGEIAAVLVREQHPVAGVIEIATELAAESLFKVRVRVENLTPLEEPGPKNRDEALLHALISTHIILGVREGSFVSLMDPPEEWRSLAASCQNVGTWPVLVGEVGEKDTLLSAPIILYDYPQIAPESPGDLFDSTEIDEILTLRILTLTDEEKQAVAAVDERARALLQRTESLAAEQLRGLHGTVRRLQGTPAEDNHE
jgi:hydrogenase maturation protease